MALPLSSSELLLLKSCQLVFNHCQNFFKGPSTKEFVKFIPDLAPETVRYVMYTVRYVIHYSCQSCGTEYEQWIRLNEYPPKNLRNLKSLLSSPVYD